jgi:hypothetical protein
MYQLSQKEAYNYKISYKISRSYFLVVLMQFKATTPWVTYVGSWLTHLGSFLTY